MYLSSSGETIVGALVKEVDKEQKPIYYVSRVLHGSKLKSVRPQQLLLALVMCAEKLKQYFQAHQIVVRTNKLLRKLLQRLDVGGKLAEWAIRLQSFNIRFKPHTTLKAHILADFITEHSSQLWIQQHQVRRLLHRLYLLMVHPMKREE